MVLPHQRVYVGIFLWYPYVMGYFVLVFLGKFLNSWRLFVVLAVTPYITMVPGFLYVYTLSSPVFNEYFPKQIITVVLEGQGEF